MKNFKDVKTGDRVRAIYEFTVKNVSSNGDLLVSSDNLWHYACDLVSVDVTVPNIKIGDWCMVRGYDINEWIGPYKIVAINNTLENKYITAFGTGWRQAKPVSPELSAMLDKEIGV
jgi:hypothetical protein